LANFSFFAAIFALMAALEASGAFFNCYLRAAIFFATLSAACKAFFLSGFFAVASFFLSSVILALSFKEYFFSAFTSAALAFNLANLSAASAFLRAFSISFADFFFSAKLLFSGTETSSLSS
jgi:hypothetical protein